MEAFQSFLTNNLAPSGKAPTTSKVSFVAAAESAASNETVEEPVSQPVISSLSLDSCPVCKRRAPATVSCSNCHSVAYCSQRCHLAHLIAHRRDGCTAKVASSQHIYAHVGSFDEDQRIKFLNLAAEAERRLEAASAPVQSSSSSYVRFSRDACTQILKDLVALPESIMFRTLPSPALYPNYFLHILRPISLAEMTVSCVQGPGYTEASDLRKDLELMVFNAESFNGRSSLVAGQARFLLDYFEKLVSDSMCQGCCRIYAGSSGRQKRLKSSMTRCDVCGDLRCRECGPCYDLLIRARGRLLQEIGECFEMQQSHNGFCSDATGQLRGLFESLNPRHYSGVMAQILEEEGLLSGHGPDTKDPIVVEIPDSSVPALLERMRFLGFPLFF